MSHFKQPVRFALALAAVAALCLAAAPAALAGKGGRPKPSGGSGSISLVALDSTDGMAHHGQRVRFNVATTATTEPWVVLKCYRNGALVLNGSEGYFERSLDDGVFGLWTPSWTAGDADCTASLTTPQWSVIASTSFHVYP